MRHGTLPALILVSIATPALAAPLHIPDQQFAFEVLAVPLTLPIEAEVDAVTEGDRKVATGSAIGNLGDLQTKALQIAQAIPLPREQCANPNGVNIVVDAINGATIKPEGNTARLELAGIVTGWGCLVGVGAPVATTQLAVTALVAFDVVSASDIGLKLAGPVELVVAGLPADVTGLLTEQINAAVNSALAEARIEGPIVIDNVPDLEVELSDAEFFDERGTLMVRLEGTSRISEATFEALLTELGASVGSGI